MKIEKPKLIYPVDLAEREDMEIRIDFTERMSRLNNEIVKMGVLVEEALDKAMDSLIKMDFDLAERVINEDLKLNDLEISIEDHCISLIAREQPVAGDLRRIITALKISTQLERMGDHAVHIAKGVKRLNSGSGVLSLFGMPEMAMIIKSMLTRVITAYVTVDAVEAEKIATMDVKVDRIHNDVIQSIFEENMVDASSQSIATTLLFINWYIERFGDHITNICEWIIYSATGEHKDLD